ncbi:MAG: hypothetical protein ACI87E_002157 [Mariniblastus sp.]|jgi:hypothetical protein
MKVHFYVLMFAVAALITTPTLADNNATGGGIANSSSISLGAGPFQHGAGVGDISNSVITGLSFAGGFNATHVRMTGTATSVLAATWGSEADIQIRSLDGFDLNRFNWQNPGDVVGGGNTFTSFDYDFSSELTGDLAGGVDPGGSTWDVEFIDTFDDGAGADTLSSNVTMTFEERTAVDDSNGVFSLGSLNVGETNTSFGEFALTGLFDTYTITLNEAALFSFSTDADPNGFTGTNVDTEIGIFDSAGNLVAEDDDGGNGTYSGIFDLELAAGDYTLAVAAFLSGASFADGFTVNPGTGTGDYTISASLTSAVPEPGSLAFLGFGCVGLLAYRRRK